MSLGLWTFMPLDILFHAWMFHCFEYSTPGHLLMLVRFTPCCRLRIAPLWVYSATSRQTASRVISSGSGQLLQSMIVCGCQGHFAPSSSRTYMVIPSLDSCGLFFEIHSQYTQSSSHVPTAFDHQSNAPFASSLISSCIFQHEPTWMALYSLIVLMCH